MKPASCPTAPNQDVTAVAEWVADIVRDRIIKGVLPAGSRIVERKLSAELDVSRTPIREALKLLQADKLIDISRHKGAQVKVYSAEQVLELFDVIASLESLAAEHLAAILTPAQLEHLEALHAQMLVHYEMGQLDEYFDINSKIHSYIITYSGNEILQEFHKKLMARAHRGRFMAIMDPDRLKQAVVEHDQLMAAFRSRDTEMARQVWRAHLQNTGKSVTEVLRHQSLS